jgi:hypothetical protein
MVDMNIGFCMTRRHCTFDTRVSAALSLSGSFFHA